MTAQKKVRVALDVALTVMIVFEMFIQFTGEFLHEVVGIAFFVSVALHIALSARWIKSTAKSARGGGVGKRRAALAVMGILLALTTVVLAVSSVAISNLLSATGFVWPIGSYAFWATAHAVSAYALCGLVAIHLAMHWVFMANAFKIPYNPARRRAIGAGVHAVAATGAVALGLAAVNSAFPLGRAIGEKAATGEVAAKSGGATTAGEAGGATAAEGAGETVATGEAARAGSAVGETAGGGAAGANAAGEAGEATNGSRNSRRKGGSPSSEKRSSDAAGAFAITGESDAAGASDAAASGICTLCRKQCSLSAPKCNKPYEAGLL